MWNNKPLYTVWNSRPCKVTSSNTLTSFKSSLKSHYFFKQCYWLCVCVCVDCVLVLYFVIGYVITFWEISHIKQCILITLVWIFSNLVVEQRSVNCLLKSTNKKGGAFQYKNGVYHYKVYVCRFTNPSPVMHVFVVCACVCVCAHMRVCVCVCVMSVSLYLCIM